MFRSKVSPLSRFLNLVRVKAAPLPGLTNWNSTMVYGLPSIKTLSPLRISEVSYMAAGGLPLFGRERKPDLAQERKRLAHIAGLDGGRATVGSRPAVAPVAPGRAAMTALPGATLGRRAAVAAGSAGS